VSVKVLFVCLGNICRSPTAHGVFEELVQRAGLSAQISVDSCGTGDWHLGHSPDPRSIAAAANRGYRLDHLRARLLVADDFDHFDFILAMDSSNLDDIQTMAPADFSGRACLFLDYCREPEPFREVPDPYYGEGDGFDGVLDLIEDASMGLLDAVRAKYGLS
jgi:protein-tyrosine phosphatase